jgi:GntR family transcriptional regulator
MIPRYKQLCEEIKMEIESKQVNAPILSERELAEKYAVSRMTARKAIDELVDAGILYRDKNKGTFVANQSLHRVFESNWVFSSINAQTKHLLLYYNVKNGDQEIADLLHSDPDRLFIRLVKLNSNPKPISVDEIYMIMNVAIRYQLDHLENMMNLHSNIERDEFIIKQSFMPVRVPVKFAAMMDLKIDDYVLQVKSEIWTKNGTLFGLVITHVNTRNFNVAVTL